MFVFSAAGFIATSTFGASPDVRMSWSANWIWKPETPGSEPAGARISAAGVWEAEEAVLWIRWSQRRRARVGAEALQGATAKVVERLSPAGRVQVRGELWSARSTSAEPIEAGAAVRILALEDLTLVVE